MTKPKMLIPGMGLLSGWGWTATSPLIYTLQRNAKYCHFGYTKSFRCLYLDPPKLQHGTDIRNIYSRVASGTWENWKSLQEGTHRLNLTEDLEPIRDFPLEHFTKLLSGIPTISKTVDYFHALHDHVIDKGYKAVGWTGIALPKTPTEFSRKFITTLTSEFDVKQIFIVRDPVRVAFSIYLNRRRQVEEDNRNILPRQLKFLDYIPKILEYYEMFGQDNVHVVAMEDLWEDDGTAKQQLSNFLDHPIPELWKNLYAPDRGHLVEYDPDVPCQSYGQNLQELTEDIYYHYKSKYQYIYDSWVDKYGSLPLYWGKHLDYNTGKPF